MLDELKEEGIVNKVGGRFKLSTLIQKRLIALNQGARPLIDGRGMDKITMVIQEIMQTKPGKQDDYIRELERLYVPWSESTGKRWLGSFITTFRFNEVIHYWALEGDWDCFENHYPSWKGSPPAEIVTWMSVAPALRDGWEDSILAALPPSPLQ